MAAVCVADDRVVILAPVPREVLPIRASADVIAALCQA